MNFRPTDPRHENEMVYGSIPGTSTHNPAFIDRERLTQNVIHGFSHFEKTSVIPQTKEALERVNSQKPNPNFLSAAHIASTRGNLRVVFKKDSIQTLNHRVGRKAAATPSDTGGDGWATPRESIQPSSNPVQLVHKNKLSQLKGGQVSPLRNSPHKLHYALSTSQSMRNLNTGVLQFEAGLSNFDARTEALKRDLDNFKKRAIEAIRNQTEEEREVRKIGARYVCFSYTLHSLLHMSVNLASVPCSRLALGSSRCNGAERLGRRRQDVTGKESWKTQSVHCHLVITGAFRQ
jgi:hypothetical protein